MYPLKGDSNGKFKIKLYKIVKGHTSKVTFAKFQKIKQTIKHFKKVFLESPANHEF